MTTARQVVTVAEGFAYGTIGADIHVAADQQPLYLLRKWQVACRPEQRWLRAVPSRLLNAAFGVVPFTGREPDIARLRGWLNTDGRLGVRWLYGVRILLIGRTDGLWPAVRTVAADLDASCTDQVVGMLDTAAGRRAMFDAGRDAFAAVFQLDPDQVQPPMALEHHDLGLTLSLHVVALVAVDAAARHRESPSDLAAMSSYLLDREQRHWQERYEQGRADAGPDPYRTPMPRMNRAVFTAALSGPVTPDLASRALTLDGTPDEVDDGAVLRDHAQIYPALTRDDHSALEPLYPDRLAEDFIALTVPGHNAEYPAQPWSAGHATQMATADLSEPVTRRAVVFLVAAAQRWKHLGDTLIGPLLQDRPELALAGGSAALTTLAHTSYADPGLLERIAAAFPEGRHLDLDAGMADITERVAEYQLRTASPDEQVRILRNLAKRLGFASRFAAARTAMVDAVRAARDLLEAAPSPKPPRDLARLATALTELGLRLWENGDSATALKLADEACTLYAGPLSTSDDYAASEARCYANRAVYLGELGRAEDALVDTERAVDLYRSIVAAGDTSSKIESELARTVYNLSTMLFGVGKGQSALTMAEEALAVRRKQAARNFETYAPDVALTWMVVAHCQQYLVHHDAALKAAQQGVAVYREIVQHNADPYRQRLAGAVLELSECQARAGHKTDARTSALEAVALYEEIAAVNPAAHEGTLAAALTTLSDITAELGRWDEAMRVQERSMTLRRRLAAVAPERHQGALAYELTRLGRRLEEMGHLDAGLRVLQEATELHRQIYDRNPTRQANELANALMQLSIQYGSVGRWADARTANEEAIDLIAQIPELSRTAWLYRMANLVHNLAIWLDKLGLKDEALARTEKAVEFYRELAGEEPGENEAHLASGLSELGIRYRQRSPQRALDAEQEALDIRRRLYTANPANNASAAELRKSLFNYSTRLVDIGRPAEALAAIDESLELARQLAAVNPAYRTEVAKSLSWRGAQLAALRRYTEAVRDEQEAVALRRPLAEGHPALHRAGLALTLHRLADHLDALGRHAEADHARAEAAALG